MRVIEVPIYNEDGSIKITMMIPPEQAHMLLQFAANYLISAGVSLVVSQANEKEPPSEDLPDVSTLQ